MSSACPTSTKTYCWHQWIQKEISHCKACNATLNVSHPLHAGASYPFCSCSEFWRIKAIGPAVDRAEPSQAGQSLPRMPFCSRRE